MRWLDGIMDSMVSKVKAKLLSRVRLVATPWTPPGSSVHGILQARVLEWGALSFSKSPCKHGQLDGSAEGPLLPRRDDTEGLGS